MEEQIRQSENKKSGTAVKVLKIVGFVFLCVVFVVLLINALLSVFMDKYYPTFGKYRLFAIVSDSMEDEIPTGHLIVCKVPDDPSEIEVDTVITYEWKNGGSTVLITHRVVAITYNEAGEARYTTKGDNADGIDTVRPTYNDVIGIYTGKSCAVLGYIIGFLTSAEGAITLILAVLIITITAIIVHFVHRVTVWRNVALAALKKSGAILGDTQIEELGTIKDVIGIVAKEPLDERDVRRKDKKLNWFIKTGTLPKRPYSDDLDESLPAVEQKMPRLVYADEDGFDDPCNVPDADLEETAPEQNFQNPDEK